MSLSGSSTALRLLDAWNNSDFAHLPEYVRDSLLENAFVVSVPAGASLYDPHQGSRLVLIIDGQARTQAISTDGREVTVRYSGAGQFVGLPSVVSGAVSVGGRAVTECEIAMLNPTALHRFATSDVAVCYAITEQFATIIYEAVEFLAGNLFGTMRQRVSRHLLDLAIQRDDGLFVRVDHQGIADAIGSVREVVARTVRQFKDEGMIERTPHGLRLVDPTGLYAIASGNRE